MNIHELKIAKLTRQLKTEWPLDASSQPATRPPATPAWSATASLTAATRAGTALKGWPATGQSAGRTFAPPSPASQA